ncbi:putative bifunctional diguanylate cyclase/phosphodiesterase [Sphingomonas morindae]|uniref:EAL domain-containing protein n=1 Tax=Sphingomonas morindae TaxID=1541170 RepID=A0ABY4X6X3_9SPHN|nr:bifunctional diguanylate cyclase/phosphodiesterase [Sphingomonas morindae]USI72626.1 EAL domain-containing protein [Sphingomonas morindae]
MLHALPMPAAIVRREEGALGVIARNTAFVALERSGSIGSVVLRPGSPIATATAALLDRDGDPLGRQDFRWRDGDVVAGRHFQVHLAPFGLASGDRACLLSLIDRTAEVESARSLRAELAHDSLTGLPNRSAFAEAVEDVVGGAGPHAVLLVDLARFSRINESLGVMAGDEVIITVARRLLSTLRTGDLLARVGGDEFGMLLQLDRGADDAMAAARRIREVLAAPFRLSGFEIGLECAIGMALLTESVESGEELVRHAQLALKRAKQSGLEEIHQPGEAACARYRLDLETELRRAIAQEALSLAFQPLIHLGRDQLVGFEALARWRHAERGPIDPSEFIPVAEETGLIVPLGRWAMNQAVATLAAWDKAVGKSLPLSVSVNVSAIQLARDDVPALVASALAAHDVAGERLTIELTESAIVQDPERATAAFRALKALDVRIAMDDFGTGYSSLSSLRRLPIDILKIDRSFVTGMLGDRDKVAIVRAVLSLADALGKKTTAEGVETAELSHMLAALGCTQGQGYLYAPPLPEAEALAYLKARL